MKKLLVLLAFVPIVQSHGQVVFCPPGAVWTSYSIGAFMSPTYFHSIKYLRDSLVGGYSSKVLHHYDLFSTKISVIRQAGDTIYLRNNFTDHEWQILYQFGAATNQTWSNVLYTYPGSSQDTVTFTTTVLNTGTVMMDNVPCRTQTLMQECSDSASYTFTVNELVGSDLHFFSFQLNRNYCFDCPVSKQLCYWDNSGFVHHFSQKPCDFGSAVDENQLSGAVRVFPNPAKDKLCILSRQGRISIIDVFGRCCMTTETDADGNIDVSALSTGSYLVVITGEKTHFARFMKL